MNGTYELEQMAPHVEGIAKDIENLGGEPGSKYHKCSGQASQFAEYFRTGIGGCCAHHRFQNIAKIQMFLHFTSHNCPCDDILQHEFIKEVVNIIDKHMNECTKEAELQGYLADRVN